ncbi:hypothetical protein FKP32DRAFT_1599691 [Trametes sanguinea]|nr:hypothetical protein FKP32DRAFT_1599691 [Trametes sanguinea]
MPAEEPLGLTTAAPSNDKERCNGRRRNRTGESHLEIRHWWSLPLTSGGKRPRGAQDKYGPPRARQRTASQEQDDRIQASAASVANAGYEGGVAPLGATTRPDADGEPRSYTRLNEDASAELLDLDDTEDLEVNSATLSMEDMIGMAGARTAEAAAEDGNSVVDIDCFATEPPPLEPEPTVTSNQPLRTASTSSQSTPLTGIPQLDFSQPFVNMLRNNPRLDDTALDKDNIALLRTPISRLPTLTPDERLSIRLYLMNSQGADEIYANTRTCILERHPEDDILSLHLVRKRIAQLTGVVAVTHDMCPASCMAYTGPWAELESCKFCAESRYDSTLVKQKRPVKKPRRQFNTYPLGLQIQDRMPHILEELLRSGGELDQISDIIDGADFWDACQRGRITEDDTCVLFSMDGAQLYEHKASNCWIYIWILVDVAPGSRYKKRYVLPGAIIPGPTKPKNFESFLFPEFHHVAALQNEGFSIWDAARDVVFISRPWIVSAGADAIGAPDITGLVSHHGKQGCRHRCGRKGRRKPGGRTTIRSA